MINLRLRILSHSTSKPSNYFLARTLTLEVNPRVYSNVVYLTWGTEERFRIFNFDLCHFSATINASYNSSSSESSFDMYLQLVNTTFSECKAIASVVVNV